MAKKCEICGKSFSLPIFPIHSKKCVKHTKKETGQKTIEKVAVEPEVEKIEAVEEKTRETKADFSHLAKMKVPELREYARSIGAENEKIRFASKDRLIKIIKTILEE